MPSDLTDSGLVASKIRVAVCSPTDPMQRLSCVLLLNGLMYEGSLPNDVFYVLYLDFRAMNMLTLPLPFYSL